MEDKLIEFIQSLQRGELEFISAKSMEMLGLDTTGRTASLPAAELLPSAAIVAGTFSVPSDIKYLESEQLEALTESFRDWYREAARPDIQRARGGFGWFIWRCATPGRVWVRSWP
jgi:hypothetical protein